MTAVQILTRAQTTRDGTIVNLDEEAMSRLIAEGYATDRRVLTEKGRRRLARTTAGQPPGTLRAVAGPTQF